jgi:hypothetical protein
MSNRLPFTLQRMFNRPQAITPEKAEIIIAALAERLGVVELSRLDGSVRHFADDEIIFEERHSEPEPRRGYDLVSGVAVIQVEGTLVQKNGTLRPYSGMTGYDGIRTNLLTALSDPKARAIAFDIDSPGGECAGCFDLADTIFRPRQEADVGDPVGMRLQRRLRAGELLRSRDCAAHRWYRIDRHHCDARRHEPGARARPASTSRC